MNIIQRIKALGEKVELEYIVAAVLVVTAIMGFLSLWYI